MPDVRLIMPDCRDSTSSLLFAYNVLEAPIARIFSLFKSFYRFHIVLAMASLEIFLVCPFIAASFILDVLNRTCW
jgi:hypothetical protein